MSNGSRAHHPRQWPSLLLALLMAVATALSPAAAQDDEGGVVYSGNIRDDLFAAGSSVNIDAIIDGDLFVAGGWVDIRTQVADNLIAGGGVMDVAGAAAGDLIAAGGMLDLAASVGDNLVVTGAIVSLEAPVGGKLFASAGRLRLGRGVTVAGDAWMAAGSADIGGHIEGSARLAAARAVLRGRIDGDLETTALSLELADGARIGGRLIHFGPEPPEIAESAEVTGGVDHRYEPKAEPEAEAERADDHDWPPVFWLLITLGLGLLLDLILPRYVQSAGALARRRPLAAFGLGLAILVVTPVLILILIISVLGLAIGVVAIAVYGTLLLIGPVVALFAGVQLVGRLRPHLTNTPTRRRLMFVAMLIVLSLIGWLPLVGPGLFWAAAVLGLGAATWQLYDSVRDEPQPAPPALPATQGES